MPTNCLIEINIIDLKKEDIFPTITIVDCIEMFTVYIQDITRTQT